MVRHRREPGSLGLDVLRKRYPDAKDPLKAWLPDRPPFRQGLPELEKLESELEAVQKRRGKVVLYCHDDMDGIAGLFVGLRILGAEGFLTSHIIPNRGKDDYGLLPERMEGVVESGDLLLTVDFGCSAVEGVEWAKGRGARVVVTDHHTLNPPLPKPHAMIDPQAVGGPATELAGCGVIYAALTELFPRWQRDPMIIAAVALGTISDRVPIYSWNRHMLGLFDGLRINSLPAGMRVILGSWPRKDGSWTAQQVRQQVTSTIGKGTDSGIDEMIDFMTSDDVRLCAAAWKTMQERSEHRAQLLSEIVSRAMLEKDPQADAMGLTLVYLGEVQPGMGGSVASKLCSIYGRGAIVVARRSDGAIVGEARSMGDWDMAAFLVGMREHFTSAGGHVRAAGFSAEVGTWPKIHELMLTRMATFPTRKVPPPHVDLRLRELPDPSELECLSPFGPGFPPPAVKMGKQRYLMQYGSGSTFWAISDESGE
ncbi:DHH family phosphoesterase [Candidatus Fermentibacterales bacterium]|nr:DHH family phosphoesterase [Candidatus Fermentibacterales bacterium]